MRDIGHSVDIIDDGVDGDAFLQTDSADVAIIDLNLPRMNGIEIIRAMRIRNDQTPVLILTARSDTRDRVAGLDAGADDYLTKPFQMEELLARVRALGRRKGILSHVIEEIGSLKFDRSARSIAGKNGQIDLPRRELGLFELLLDNRGRVASKSSLYGQLYGTGADIDPNALELLVSRLRRKLETTGVIIRTVRGLGYMLDTESGH